MESAINYLKKLHENPKRVAIVGSEEKYWINETRDIVTKRIREIFKQYMVNTGSMFHPYDSWDDPKSVMLISGGCPRGGVDIWAEIIADSLGVQKTIFQPDECVWSIRNSERKGFKERNIEIAENCDVLYCFDPLERTWSGARWTFEYAKKMGKETYLELI